MGPGGNLRTVTMPAPEIKRGSAPSPLVAAVCGVLLGVAVFVIVAGLWRAGATHAAAFTADATFMAALTALAGIAVLARPAKLRRARVPISRALPRAWWPRDVDTFPLIAACAGTPLVISAGAAVLLFR
jgi:hypothetical protein